MRAVTVAETGFDIGWDFARFGRVLDASSSEQSALAGYRAGREHFRIPQHRPDRFVSKWLQLRLNAFRRRRILDAEVTPAYLRRIDCATCPITLISMTHAALSESDWSVDRINNDGAYAPGNLMMMCVKANRAKGAKGYREVIQLASGSAQGAEPGLSRHEWARLACVMVGAANLPGAIPTLLPLLTRIPEDSRAPLYFVFQQMLLVSARIASERNRVMKALCRLHPSSERSAVLRCAVERLAVKLRTIAYAYDALSDEGIQRPMRHWFVTLPAASIPGLLQLCSQYGAERCETAPPVVWALEVSGRF
ncbi:hypothetical protein QCE63_33920 [Caballeronia sp. LZ065]|uniref:hypothetical protein n=1 Tax=Caballeronia sp. LZ065 TaxID=3038571 RepID=UPI0028541EC5|nr:hypothetical protein [Caballeronia sp. LZ065]MDR5784419.1 hypothetical protein [Caballeronia sp. LZ065]